MKFFVLALLVLVCFKGFYCAPFFKFLVPESSQINYGRQTTVDIPKLLHIQSNRGFDWNVKWPARNPRRQYEYPQPGYGYPQQGHGYPQQYDYSQQYEDNYPQQPQPGYGYPQQGHGYPQQYDYSQQYEDNYPQQYNDWPQQHEDPRRGLYKNYKGQYK